MKSFSLMICAFYRDYFRKIHPLGYPAFRTIGKRRGFHEFPSYIKFPAVNAEPAVLNRLFFV